MTYIWASAVEEVTATVTFTAIGDAVCNIIQLSLSPIQESQQGVFFQVHLLTHSSLDSWSFVSMLNSSPTGKRAGGLTISRVLELRPGRAELTPARTIMTERNRILTFVEY